MRAAYCNSEQTIVAVTLAAGEALNGESGPGTWQLGPDASAAYVASGVSIAAYTPPPPAADTIEGRLLVKALTDAQYAAIKTRDQDRIAADPSIQVGNSLMTRAAAKAGITVADWVAAARKPG